MGGDSVPYPPQDTRGGGPDRRGAVADMLGSGRRCVGRAEAGGGGGGGGWMNGDKPVWPMGAVGAPSQGLLLLLLLISLFGPKGGSGSFWATS